MEQQTFEKVQIFFLSFGLTRDSYSLFSLVSKTFIKIDLISMDEISSLVQFRKEEQLGFLHIHLRQVRVEPKMLFGFFATQPLFWIVYNSRNTKSFKKGLKSLNYLRSRPSFLCRILSIVQPRQSEAKGNFQKQFHAKILRQPSSRLSKYNSAIEHFRSFVIYSASFGEHFFISSTEFHIFTNPKIDDFQQLLFAFIQHVFRLYIAMENSVLVDVFRTLKKFVEYFLQLILTETHFEVCIGRYSITKWDFLCFEFRNRAFYWITELFLSCFMFMDLVFKN